MSQPLPPPPHEHVSWLGALFNGLARKLVGLGLLIAMIWTGVLWQTPEEFRQQQVQDGIKQTQEYCAQPFVADEVRRDPYYMEPQCVNYFPAEVAKVCKGWTPGTEDWEFTGVADASLVCDPEVQRQQPYPTRK